MSGKCYVLSSQTVIADVADKLPGYNEGDWVAYYDKDRQMLIGKTPPPPGQLGEITISFHVLRSIVEHIQHNQIWCNLNLKPVVRVVVVDIPATDRQIVRGIIDKLSWGQSVVVDETGVMLQYDARVYPPDSISDMLVIIQDPIPYAELMSIMSEYDKSPFPDVICATPIPNPIKNKWYTCYDFHEFLLHELRMGKYSKIVFRAARVSTRTPAPSDEDAKNAREISRMLTSKGCLVITTTLSGNTSDLRAVCTTINTNKTDLPRSEVDIYAGMTTEPGFNYPVIEVYKGEISLELSYDITFFPDDVTVPPDTEVIAKWTVKRISNLMVNINASIKVDIQQTEWQVDNVSGSVPDGDGDITVSYKAPSTPGMFSIFFNLTVGKHQISPVTLSQMVTVVESLSPLPLFRSGSHLQLVYNMTSAA